MRQILLEDGAQMQTIGNWYTNIEKKKKKRKSYRKYCQKQRKEVKENQK
jgi:hypothetical protein